MWFWFARPILHVVCPCTCRFVFSFREPVRLPPYCSSDPDIPVKLRLDPTADTYHHEKPQTIIDMFKKAVNNYKDETALAMKLVVEPDEEKDDKKEAEEKDKKKEAKEEEEDEEQTERLSPESARIREKMEKERRQKQKEKEKRKRKRSLRGQHQWKTWTFEEYYDACITAAKAFIEVIQLYVSILISCMFLFLSVVCYPATQCVCWVTMHQSGIYPT